MARYSVPITARPLAQHSPCLPARQPQGAHEWPRHKVIWPLRRMARTIEALRWGSRSWRPHFAQGGGDAGAAYSLGPRQMTHATWLRYDGGAPRHRSRIAVGAMRLLDCFAPLFSYGLLVDEQTGPQASPTELASVQARARVLVDQARTAGLAEGKSLADVEMASFAAVAGFDEMIKRHEGWEDQASPLQLSLFHTGGAASEFFDHLARLASDAEEVREVFSMALLLGFTGQYYYEQGDGGELGRIKALYCRPSATASEVLQSLQREPITPQPYQAAGSPALHLPGAWAGRRTVQWVATFVVLLVLVAFVAPVFSRAIPAQAWYVAALLVAVV